eukprot:CAMPEP_0176477038 /NCGR_PEP_ID=MMETSP0200_2-20121128/393_1 /TAXON_ID=947934 /ORGANISM="Chaetoceros sp., Strain GSL56" /LENGTH=215 /DNA_ID=CAMNT_0017872789 /DNA_START=46 /DNA_END=696 /DNA_ORIENTATION=-
MTKVWYKNVLDRQNDQCVILDVGIGTASALLQCKDIVQKKNLRIIGIDYNDLYVQAAQKEIQQQEMNSCISVHKCDIYNQEELIRILSLENITQVDSVYFSGSFSLLPDPKSALLSIQRVLKEDNDNSGRVYITQTYQKRPSFFMRKVKPMLKFLTTIDFGQLVTLEEIRDLLEHVDGLTLEQHEVMDDSLDNYWQAAYLSVLVKNGNGNNKVDT